MRAPSVTIYDPIIWVREIDTLHCSCNLQSQSHSHLKSKELFAIKYASYRQSPSTIYTQQSSISRSRRLLMACCCCQMENELVFSLITNTASATAAVAVTHRFQCLTSLPHVSQVLAGFGNARQCHCLSLQATHFLHLRQILCVSLRVHLYVCV